MINYHMQRTWSLHFLQLWSSRYSLIHPPSVREGVVLNHLTEFSALLDLKILIKTLTNDSITDPKSFSSSTWSVVQFFQSHDSQGFGKGLVYDLKSMSPVFVSETLRSFCLSLPHADSVDPVSSNQGNQNQGLYSKFNSSSNFLVYKELLGVLPGWIEILEAVSQMDYNLSQAVRQSLVSSRNLTTEEDKDFPTYRRSFQIASDATEEVVSCEVTVAFSKKEMLSVCWIQFHEMDLFDVANWKLAKHRGLNSALPPTELMTVQRGSSSEMLVDEDETPRKYSRHAGYECENSGNSLEIPSLGSLSQQNLIGNSADAFGKKGASSNSSLFSNSQSSSLASSLSSLSSSKAPTSISSSGSISLQANSQGITSVLSSTPVSSFNSTSKSFSSRPLSFDQAMGRFDPFLASVSLVCSDSASSTAASNFNLQQPVTDQGSIKIDDADTSVWTSSRPILISTSYSNQHSTMTQPSSSSSFSLLGSPDVDIFNPNSLAMVLTSNQDGEKDKDGEQGISSRIVAGSMPPSLPFRVDSVDTLLRRLLRYSPFDLVEIWVPVLRPVPSTALDSLSRREPMLLFGTSASTRPEFRGWASYSRHFVFGSQVGLPGRVSSRSIPEVFQDVSSLSKLTYLRVHGARSLGIHASVGIPLASNNGRGGGSGDKNSDDQNHVGQAVVVFYSKDIFDAQPCLVDYLGKMMKSLKMETFVSSETPTFIQRFHDSWAPVTDSSQAALDNRGATNSDTAVEDNMSRIDRENGSDQTSPEWTPEASNKSAENDQGIKIPVSSYVVQDSSDDLSDSSSTTSSSDQSPEHLARVKSRSSSHFV